ncbi:hypothetical protein [Yersinia massiliensis]|uniref:hypothetical protein n=1 Tax=Yersinia massiliensis TaxID=419257 RepID=UPI00117EA0EA|nr:hypothetical protein [Yersinia massiliensis]
MMNTQNAATTAPKIAKKRGALRQALEDAIGEVAMAEEAHAHYGEQFGFRGTIRYWLYGFFNSFKEH